MITEHTKVTNKCKCNNYCMNIKQVIPGKIIDYAFKIIYSTNSRLD